MVITPGTLDRTTLAHLVAGTPKENTTYSKARVPLKQRQAAEIKWLALNSRKTQAAIGKLYAWSKLKLAT
jgi:hypothetical protein